jgi:predicted transcriptional regulator
MASQTGMAEDVYKKLRIIFCSDQRRDLLVSLNSGKKSLSDLHDELQLDSPTMIHNLRELEANRLVRESAAREYYLTKLGKNVARGVIHDYRRTEVLVKYETFWCEHDLDGIPDHLFDRIGALHDSALVQDSELDPFKAYSSFVELFKEFTVLRLISSVSAPDPHLFFDDLISAEIHVKLVLTEPVLQHVIEELGEATVKESLARGHELYVTRHNPRLVLAIADPFMTLLLYNSEGGFDYSTALRSQSKEAATWAGDVFRYYVKLSRSVTL